MAEVKIVSPDIAGAIQAMEPQQMWTTTRQSKHYRININEKSQAQGLQNTQGKVCH